MLNDIIMYLVGERAVWRFLDDGIIEVQTAQGGLRLHPSGGVCLAYQGDEDDEEDEEYSVVQNSGDLDDLLRHLGWAERGRSPDADLFRVLIDEGVNWYLDDYGTVEIEIPGDVRKIRLRRDSDGDWTYAVEQDAWRYVGDRLLPFRDEQDSGVIRNASDLLALLQEWDVVT